MNEQSSLDGTPWYRQTWAWFVLSPLILVVLVCTVLVSVAYKKADDVVIDNYYKEGRMINQRIEEDRLAKEAGLGAQLRFDMLTGEVLLSLSAQDQSIFPSVVMLHLDHPVEADFDLQVELHNIAPGRYRADLENALAHRWYVRLMPKITADNAGQFWRLVGEVNLTDSDVLKLGYE